MAETRSSEYYRSRADQLRLAATVARSLNNRETLIMLAEDFDELANTVESKDFSDRTAD
jgi:predicted ATPase